ncbi:hypothetical protein Salat_2975400 [Sesamum alatum]|uniref:Uncharacterized protein n=1 Tax=Sesamum alatum TaxID=300844 RepID=A0AAE2C7N2_9LAMI|nr:hypothetical protein Salat_2975400 [Sesamum alatum]
MTSSNTRSGLIPYQKSLSQLLEKFEEVTFFHLSREKKKFADALPTLASMTKMWVYQDSGISSRGNRKGEQFGGYPWGSSVVDKSYLNEVMMEHSSDAGNAHKCQMNADKINAPTAPLSLAK